MDKPQSPPLIGDDEDVKDSWDVESEEEPGRICPPPPPPLNSLAVYLFMRH